MKLLCYLGLHKYKFYKRYGWVANPLSPEFKVLRQWKRCLRCSKKEVEE